ncbi:hypothetical protein CC78DRAFT_577170 [Lojkania enalia]|uniref:Uncharacterized protein n=1 Tax=Lojkania enalia TaxID=147567 RepID=A0A9P4KDZ2_9PLEO|nr:hypothetical protein CC78DRAFT_577170 [Didymosphaeria enalia]
MHLFWQWIDVTLSSSTIFQHTQTPSSTHSLTRRLPWIESEGRGFQSLVDATAFFISFLKGPIEKFEGRIIYPSEPYSTEYLIVRNIADDNASWITPMGRSAALITEGGSMYLTVIDHRKKSFAGKWEIIIAWGQDDSVELCNTESEALKELLHVPSWFVQFVSTKIRIQDLRFLRTFTDTHTSTCWIP